MSFEELVRQMRLDLMMRWGEDYEFQAACVQKINGVEQPVLRIRRKGNSVGIQIGIGDVCDRIRKGGNRREAEKELMGRVEEGLKQIRSGETVLQMGQGILDYREARERLVYRLIQTRRNERLLRQIPHVPYLDLSIVFELYWKQEDQHCSCLVYNSHLEQWGVTVEELLAQARENTPKLLPAKSDSLNKIIRTMTAAMGEEKWEGQERWENQWMYFLSNQEYFHGAAAVLYEGELKRIADLFGSNLIVLPSSVNEVLLLPERLWPDIAGFAELIQEINQKEVEQEEWLSDHPYRYLRGEDRLEAA